MLEQLREQVNKVITLFDKIKYDIDEDTNVQLSDIDLTFLKSTLELLKQKKKTIEEDREKVSVLYSKLENQLDRLDTLGDELDDVIYEINSLLE